jgi:malate dehydrogenase (oxaloacetate-decarboxylating)
MKIPEILLVESQHRPGSLAKVLTAIGECGCVVEHLNAIKREQDQSIWEITLELDPGQYETVKAAIDALPNARVLGHSDRVFDRHAGGKVRMTSRAPLNSLQELRDVYTPGVARVCLAIQADPKLAWDYTALPHTVAIITNGTAILGLGDIGALAGLPVIEGKAALFAKLADLSGIPILIQEKDPQVLIDVISAIAPSFGAIQLEDIKAPECFEIERVLRARLSIPVLHDDQHGTAVVVLAALISASRIVGRDLRQQAIGQIGLGAAGLGIVRLLMQYGASHVVGTDLNESQLKMLEQMGGQRASLTELMARCDVVVATTGRPGLIKPEMVRPGQMVFALSNPEPEIEPRVARERGAVFAADGRGINNVLGFPGLFRGALDAHASEFTDAMLFAAAEAIADCAPKGELVPDPLDRRVHDAVASAVRRAAGGSTP